MLVEAARRYPDLTLLEAYKVLRRDRLVVTVTDSAEDIEGRTMSRYFPESRDNELRRYPRIKTLTEAMKRAGFAQVRATSTVHSATPTYGGSRTGVKLLQPGLAGMGLYTPVFRKETMQAW